MNVSVPAVEASDSRTYRAVKDDMVMVKLLMYAAASAFKFRLCLASLHALHNEIDCDKSERSADRCCRTLQVPKNNYGDALQP